MTKRILGATPRRVATVAAVIAVAAMTIAGCSAGGGGTTPDTEQTGQWGKGRTITALVPTAGAGLADQYKEYYDALAAKFEEDTGATVEWQYFNNTDEANTIVQTSLASSSGPDLLSYGSSFGGTYAATGGFHVLTEDDWAKLGGRDSYLPSMISMSGATPDEEIGVPHTSAPYAMAYNKQLLANAGVTAPPTTWDEFVDVAKRVQAANPGVYGAGFDPADGFDPWKFVWSYTKQLGGDFVSDDNTTATLDSDQVDDAVTFFFRQYYDFGIVPPESLGWKNAEMVSAFLAGKVAMLPIATKSVATAAGTDPIADDIAFAPLPDVPYGLTERPAGGTPALSIVAGRYWAMPSYADKNLDLSLALIKASTSLDIQEKQYDLVGWAPTTNESLQTITDEHPEDSDTLDIIQEMEPTAFTGAWATIQSGISSVVAKAANRLAQNGTWDPNALREDLAGVNASAQRQM